VKALVLDFDGVIADSAREAFAVALRTYTAMRSGTRLPARAAEAVYPAFLAIVPLGNRAEDFAVALLALEAGVALPDQAAYDAFKARQDAAWLQAFHARFYETRAALAAADPDAWRALRPPYPGLLAGPRRRAGDAALAIATAKDRASVGALLAHYGAADLFTPQLVLDKETGVHKTDHLRHLARRLSLDFRELTFVDDKVNHLDAVAALGVRCALAAWGVNGPREHRLAAERGHLVCRLDDFEAQVYGGVPGRRGPV
jgi:phosphoglycolate phosphatase-like HAD superfamily hydrolase